MAISGMNFIKTFTPAQKTRPTAMSFIKLSVFMPHYNTALDLSTNPAMGKLRMGR